MSRRGSKSRKNVGWDNQAWLSIFRPSPSTDSARHQGGDTIRQDPGPGRSGASAPPALALPCLFKTTAPADEYPPLPGPKKKQAETLTQNIEWMGDTFGKERIGFLTLTVGDVKGGGKFWKLRDRKEAQRRFHSLLTHEISKRYACGVTVTERHRDGGIHFHLAVVCSENIRGEIDFLACFPPKDADGKYTHPPDYSTANDAIKREWAYWRRVCKKYGFGRHQLQPVKATGEALGRYMGKYLSKDWAHRPPEDKGARCVRYFGHWSKEPRAGRKCKQTPPNKARFSWLTPRARAFREMVKQIIIVLNHKGAKLTQENIKEVLGRRWAWKIGKLMKAVGFVEGEWQSEEMRKTIAEHNETVRIAWLVEGGDPKQHYWWHVTELTLDHLRPSPEWMEQSKELEQAKRRDALLRREMAKTAEAKRACEEKVRLVQEVADLFKTEWPKLNRVPPP